jgi:hypothetical protein
VCLVSMATSSGEELPRDIEFLFSVNRLNVAVSRAQALCIIFASPRLLDVPCRTIEQMRLVNTLCSVADHASLPNPVQMIRIEQRARPKIDLHNSRLSSWHGGLLPDWRQNHSLAQDHWLVPGCQCKDRYEMKTSLFALAVLVAMTGAALPQFRTFYDSTSGGVTGRATTDSGGATTYYGADGGHWPLGYHRQHHDDP